MPEVICKGVAFTKHSKCIVCCLHNWFLYNLNIPISFCSVDSLVRADFSGSDLRGASLEDTSMDEATLKNAIVAGAYFSNSIVDTKDLGNVDFSDAQVPMKTLPLLCERDDVKGTNPVTGADTRESLMCP